MAGLYNDSSAYQYEEQEYYSPEQIPREEQQKKRNLQPQKRSKAQQQPSKLKTILCILTCFAITFFIMLRYVAITEASNTVDSYKRELNQLQRITEQTEVQLERSINLRKIEELAKSELGMREPQAYQVVHVDLDRNDYSEIIDLDTNHSKKGTFKLILDRISNVLEYLY